MELKDIQNLIKFVAKSGASEVKLEMEDVKITIKTGSDEKETIVQHMQMPAQMPQQMAAAPAPAPAQPVAQAAAAAPADSNNGDDSKYITVKSPIIGTLHLFFKSFSLL